MKMKTSKRLELWAESWYETSYTDMSAKGYPCFDEFKAIVKDLKKQGQQTKSVKETVKNVK